MSWLQILSVWQAEHGMKGRATPAGAGDGNGKRSGPCSPPPRRGRFFPAKLVSVVPRLSCVAAGVQRESPRGLTKSGALAPSSARRPHGTVKGS